MAGKSLKKLKQIFKTFLLEIKIPIWVLWGKNRPLVTAFLPSEYLYLNKLLVSSNKLLQMVDKVFIEFK